MTITVMDENQDNSYSTLEGTLTLTDTEVIIKHSWWQRINIITQIKEKEIHLAYTDIIAVDFKPITWYLFFIAKIPGYIRFIHNDNSNNYKFSILDTLSAYQTVKDPYLYCIWDPKDNEKFLKVKQFVQQRIA